MFSGSIVALVTPMSVHGDIDYASLQNLVAWHLASGTDALVILGTTGESATVEPAERVEIIRRVVDQLANQIPVIVGTGTHSTRHTIELTQEAMKLGADAVLLVTPYYNKPTQEGLFQHFKAVAQAVPIPQILYNVPSRTGCDLLPETVLRLGVFANIVGLKEATGDIRRVQQLLTAGCTMDLLSGDDKTAMEFILAGGKGVISVVANVVPKEFHQLCAALLAGDKSLAERLNTQLSPLYTQLFVESNPIPTKWALARMARIPEGIRLPLTPLSADLQVGVLKAMQIAGIQT